MCDRLLKIIVTSNLEDVLAGKHACYQNWVHEFIPGTHVVVGENLLLQVVL